ncbi:hypothetical protein KP509_04G063600 [Ceratopteris richardii]|uniref:Uncharacterized protein n=1 Tax=Ceratopteris richardii TaxID=49495 RepID=A0A8T2UXN1_CERRI|nr:hypothetical protein KP509_04G063600 [Ceratopteris richardii]
MQCFLAGITEKYIESLPQKLLIHVNLLRNSIHHLPNRGWHLLIGSTSNCSKRHHLMAASVYEIFYIL